MARVTLQQFATAIDNISIDFLAHRGVTLALGRWTAGAATGELNFEGVPSFAAPPKATERQRKDYKNAAVLLGLKPRWCFDSWIAARQELADFLIEEHRLETLGYTAEALRIELTNWANNKTSSREDPAWTALGRHVAKVHGYMVEAASVYDKLSHDFGAFNETEAQAAAYDLALVDNFKKMDPFERSAWLAVMARPDGTVDKRTLIALFRVPPVLTGLSDLELSNIGAAYFRSEWPQTADAIVILNQCIGAAHDGLRTAVKEIADRIGTPAENLPGVTEDAAEWLLSDFNHSFQFAPPTSRA
jgi:hypothetical protein